RAMRGWCCECRLLLSGQAPRAAEPHGLAARVPKAGIEELDRVVGGVSSALDVPVGALGAVVAAALEHDEPRATVGVLGRRPAPHGGLAARPAGLPGGELPLVLGGQAPAAPRAVRARVVEVDERHGLVLGAGCGTPVDPVREEAVRDG